MATTGDGPEEVDDLGLDQKALEALIVDNPDLERLEALLGQFNIFEAIGAVRQEVRHSNFLSFLLNPRETHGLGDEFAKRFLQRVLLTSPQPEMPLRPIDLDLWSLDGLVIQREWENVDILLLDESHKLAAIIENKIDSTERPGQLHRYWNSTSQHYPGWSIVGLYLTPSGDAPECDMYLAVGYSVVCATLENLVGSRAASMGPDVLTMLRHYTQMLRRHIVGESEIDLLCRQIYRKHQRALDIVFERRPDRQSEVRVMVEELIRATPGLVLDRTSKTYIDFGVSAWDVPALLVGKGYTISGRILTFEFANNVDNLKLRLVIGPGPIATRELLLKMAGDHEPLKPRSSTLGKQFNSIYSRSFLAPRSYEGSNEDIYEEISGHWERFVKEELPVIVPLVLEHVPGQDQGLDDYAGRGGP